MTLALNHIEWHSHTITVCYAWEFNKKTAERTHTGEYESLLWNNNKSNQRALC